VGHGLQTGHRRRRSTLSKACTSKQHKCHPVFLSFYLLSISYPSIQIHLNQFKQIKNEFNNIFKVKAALYYIYNDRKYHLGPSKLNK